MASRDDAKELNKFALSKLQEMPQKALEEIRTSGLPWLVNLDEGEGVVVQEANAYREMLDIVDSAEAIAGIRRGLESMERGEGRPARAVFADMKRRHGIATGD